MGLADSQQQLACVRLRDEVGSVLVAIDGADRGAFVYADAESAHSDDGSSESPHQAKPLVSGPFLGPWLEFVSGLLVLEQDPYVHRYFEQRWVIVWYLGPVLREELDSFQVDRYRNARPRCLREFAQLPCKEEASDYQVRCMLFRVVVDRQSCVYR